MRVRILLCVVPLLLLAAVHLPASDARPQPPVASQPAHTYTYQPSGTPRPIDGQTPAQARLAAFYEWASRQPPPKPLPTKSEKSRKVPTAPIAYQDTEYEPGTIEALICSVFGDSCPRAIRIARCESGLNPSARNRSGASGLFQIMMPMHADLFDDPADVFDPRKNIDAAYTLSSGGSNWRAWSCR